MSNDGESNEGPMGDVRGIGNGEVTGLVSPADAKLIVQKMLAEKLKEVRETLKRIDYCQTRLEEVSLTNFTFTDGSVQALQALAGELHLYRCHAIAFERETLQEMSPEIVQ